VNKLKYIFIFLSLLLLVLMLIMSIDAGVNCDEVLHYGESEAVYNYFASHGRDLSALDTPTTQLKYYGQSYDNITTFLIKIFNIDDVYDFRHIMSTLAGWLTVLVTALFAVWMEGYGTGIIVILLFAVSPTFLGHAQNNLKDIPFALSYISSLYLTFRFLSSTGRSVIKWSVFLILSIAFSISIRVGGLILICYLFLFGAAWFLTWYLKGEKKILKEGWYKLILIVIISVAAYFLGLILWPFALQDPIRNPFVAYHVMLRYPETFMQIFEGKMEWSDYMPWYYLPKSMLITIPLIVSSGILLFVVFVRKILSPSTKAIWWFIIFAVLFPVVFVVYEKSNLYSSWRQFLFVYPPIILIAASGLFYSLRRIRNLYIAVPVYIVFILLSLHPIRYLVNNHKYAYLYYNQLVGGVKGAYGNYETDYYFVSQREAAEWLEGYLRRNKINDTVIVGANFSVEWFFRKDPLVTAKYFRNEERSLNDWDYSIVTNRYISPFKLKNCLWPPDDALRVVYADGAPISAVVKRESKEAYYGYLALKQDSTGKAIQYLGNVVDHSCKDEMIFYNFAVALYRDGRIQKADSVLKASLSLNPEFVLSLMFLGYLSELGKQYDKALGYYQDVISANRKYFEAYTALANIIAREDLVKARSVLRDCLKINPSYKPAIVALADTYRHSDPEIARKYDELANGIK
jgi:tetratricopeptide (TPR) repeat protein